MKSSILKQILVLILLSSFAFSSGFPKKYYKMKASITKQEFFYDFLFEKIKIANKNILKQREFILSLNNNINLDQKTKEYKKLSKIAKKYAVKNPFDYNKLLKKVNIVPASLALAQASVESAWGTSRFVKLGNNLFGHWTYGKKGIMPLKRDKGAKHLIRIFDSLEDSIAAYMLNLNKSRAYSSFRNKREVFVKNNKSIDGLALSQTMINYSGIGKKYLWILKRMIKRDKLKSYDLKFEQYLNTSKT